MSGSRELDAAGIRDPALRASYERCRRLNARHGRSFFLATRLLPAGKRPYVHALYGFAREVDDVLDGPGTVAEKAARLRGWADRLHAGAAEPALHDTVARWSVPVDLLDVFLASMEMDLTVTGYETYDDLAGYMRGSAAAIGRQVLPVLEPLPGLADVAATYAADLGVAFQLTNFVRDVGEDLRRGRVYLPREDLRAFGVTRDDLAGGVVDGRVRRLLAFEVARTREVYRSAEPGTRLLHPSSRPCVTTALRLYRGILDAVERADYQVLDRRVRVGPARRLLLAAPALLTSARRGAPTTPTTRRSG